MTRWATDELSTDRWSTAMERAIAEAGAAAAHDDVPIGAVVVRDGTVIAARHDDASSPATRPPTPRSSPFATRRRSSGTGGSTTARWW